MGKSKFGSPTFPTVAPVQRGDTSRDASRVDRTGTSSSGPTSGYKTDGKDNGSIDKAYERKALTEDR